LGLFAEDVETDSLGEGSALSDSHDVTDNKTESRGFVACNSLVAFLESSVFLDEVEVIASDDNVVFHFVGNYDTPKLISRVRSIIIYKISVLLV